MMARRRSSLRTSLFASLLASLFTACAASPPEEAPASDQVSGGFSSAWPIVALAFDDGDVSGGRIVGFRSGGLWFHRADAALATTLETASPRLAAGEARLPSESILSEDGASILVRVEGQGWWQSAGPIGTGDAGDKGQAVALDDLPAAIRAALTRGPEAAWGVAAIRSATAPEDCPVYRVELISGVTTDPRRDRWTGLEFLPNGQLRRRFVAVPRALNLR